MTLEINSGLVKSEILTSFTGRFVDLWCYMIKVLVYLEHRPRARTC